MLAFAVAFTGAVTPGSLLALVIGQVLVHGLPAVLMILLGHALLEGVFLLGFYRGLGRCLENRRLRASLALIGGLVMAWMGMDLVFAAARTALSKSDTQHFSLLLLIPAGASVSLVNPYFTGWWATIGSAQVVTFGLTNRRRYLAFWLGHELGDAVWYVFVAIMLIQGRQWLSDAVYQHLLSICGYVMCALALLFVFVGLILFSKPAEPPLAEDM